MGFIDSTNLPDDETFYGPSYRVTQRGVISLTWRSSGIRHPEHERQREAVTAEEPLGWHEQNQRSWANRRGGGTR